MTHPAKVALGIITMPSRLFPGGQAAPQKHDVILLALTVCSSSSASVLERIPVGSHIYGV